MKKFWVILVFLLLSNLIIATDQPTTTAIGEGDVEKTKEVIDTYMPLDDSGKVDYKKYDPFKSKAEERIDGINLWLETNAGWLKVVFGIVPSITWLFLINLYFWLWFFTFLVLNANKTFGMFFFLEKKITGDVTWGNISGILLFIVLLFSKFYVNLAKLVINIIIISWYYVLPLGIIAIIFLIVLIGVLFYFFPVVMTKIFGWLKKMALKKREAKEKDKESTNREALDTLVKGALDDQ